MALSSLEGRGGFHFSNIASLVTTWFPSPACRLVARTANSPNVHPYDETSVECRWPDLNRKGYSICSWGVC